MDTLVRHPQSPGAPDPGAGPAGPAAASAAPEVTPEPEGRTCRACGAALAPAQDWCLACGTAAPGRLGRRPGLKAAAAVAGVTLLVAGGAATAGYAALSARADQQAAAPAPADGTPIAQAAPVIADPPALVLPAPRPKAVATPKADPTPVEPVTPVADPAPITPVGTSSTGTTGSSGTTTTTTTTTEPEPEPKPVELKAITVDQDAGGAYDPFTRALEQGDPARALDDDASTRWFVSTPDDGKEMQVGLMVDLGSSKTVKALDLTTSTPGFRVEIYGADGSEVPPDILDTRWSHLISKAIKTTKGEQRIELGSGADRVRRVLLWITKPPAEGPRVSISSLRLLR